MQGEFETSGAVGWLLEEIRKALKVDVSRDFAAVGRVREAAKTADDEFQSGAATAKINLPFITATASGPKHFSRSVSREEWNEAKRAVGQADGRAVVASDSPERLADPPRRVPISMAIVNALNWSTMIGLLVFGFGLVYVAQAFDENDPSRSRIFGMRPGIWDWSSPQFIVLTLLLVIGLSTIAVGLRMGRRRNDLLRAGPLAMGKLIATRRTDPNLEDPDYDLTFEFTARGARREAKVRINDISGVYRRVLLADEGPVPLLFDPGDPSRAYLLEAQPARPRIDEHGHLRGRIFAAVARLILAAGMLAAIWYVAATS